MAYNQQQGQQAAWTSLPLPAGYEAKYDPGQKRYFFINHSTKVTGWEDPRKAVWEQRQNASKQAWGTLSTGGSVATHQPRSSPRPSPKPSPKLDQIPMTDLTNRSVWEKQVEDKYGLKVQHIKMDNEEETSLQPSLSSGAHGQLSKLNAEFPSADVEIIKDVLSSCHYDESQTRNQLKSLGYSHVRSGQTKDVSPRHSPRPGPGIQAPYHASGRTHTESPRRATSPKPPAPSLPTGPSPAQKTRSQEKIGKEFPNLAKRVVEMALDASNYDESKTRLLLHSMVSSRQSSPSKGVTEPAGKTISTASTSKITVAGGSTVSTSNTPVAVGSITSTSKTNVASGSTTRMGQKVLVQKLKVTAVEPKPIYHGTYMSTNRIQAKGPEVSLAKGPNLENILDNYENAKGPNPYNCQGPHGAEGHDPTLVSGPDQSHRSSGNSDKKQNTAIGHVYYKETAPMITAL